MDRDLSMAKLDEARAKISDGDAGKDEKDLERWACTVAGLLHQVAPIPPKPLANGACEPIPRASAAWQGDVEPMTLTGNRSNLAAAGDAIGAVSSLESSQQRIQVRVQTEEYGEVAVVIERVVAGLRILVGAEDGRALRALLQQSQAVRSALGDDGQNIERLEFVRMNTIGTGLASRTAMPNQRVRPSRDSEAQSSGPEQRKRKTKRVNLTG